MRRTIAFVLPGADAARALLHTDYSARHGRVEVNGQTVLEAATADELARGVTVALAGRGTLRLAAGADGEFALSLDGRPAPREETLARPATRSAWLHAWIALAGSFLGFVASWLYFRRAQQFADPWAMKMALHMAAWHLLLTLTLFPASVAGQRPGIRAVQAVSALFFAIHVSLALANLSAEAGREEGPTIALLNAASGLAFLASALYGQRAWRDMDPRSWRPPCSSIR